jgi:hypothetical protein
VGVWEYCEHEGVFYGAPRAIGDDRDGRPGYTLRVEMVYIIGGGRVMPSLRHAAARTFCVLAGTLELICPWLSALIMQLDKKKKKNAEKIPAASWSF